MFPLSDSKIHKRIFFINFFKRLFTFMELMEYKESFYSVTKKYLLKTTMSFKLPLSFMLGIEL